MTLKVAIIIPRIEQCGPVRVIQTLVNYLSINKTIDLNVFYLDKKVDPFMEFKIPLARYSFSKFRFEDFDIIHTNGIRPDLFAFLNRKKIKYHIVTIHNFVFEDLRFRYNRFISYVFGRLWLLLWKKSDRLVCVSETMKAYYSKWFLPTKLKVIHNGVGETDISSSLANELILSIDKMRSSGLKIAGYIGNLTRRKGVDQLIRMAGLEKTLGLVIIGDGEEHQALVRLAEKHDVTTRCIFCGFKSNATSYLKFFDVFIMPSRSEGFGLALVEAVSNKVLVICSDLNVFHELFSENEVTFFEPENIESMRNALHVSIENGPMKSVSAYNRYRSCYTDEIMASKYLELYKSIS